MAGMNAADMFVRDGYMLLPPPPWRGHWPAA